MCKLQQVICSWINSAPGRQNRLTFPQNTCHSVSIRIAHCMLCLTAFLLLVFSTFTSQGQYLIESFKPKIKAPLHTARHILQDDGKIVMLGDYAFIGDTPAANLLRFNQDGSLDSDFNLSDELQDEFTTDFRQCCIRPDVILGPEGDLVLKQAWFTPRVAIINKSGKFKNDISIPPGYFQFERLIKHKEGYIAIVHKTGSEESIFRLDKSGVVDPSFTRIDYSGNVENMIVDANNNIFIIGDLTIAGVKMNLIKVNESGLLDTSFNNVSLPVSFADIDLFADGRIVVSSGTEIFLLDAHGNKIESFKPETVGNQIYSSVVDSVNNRIIILLDQYPLPVAVKALELNGSVSKVFTPIVIKGISGNALASIVRHKQQFVLNNCNEIEYADLLHSFLVFDAKGNVDTKISTKEKPFSVGTVNAAVELEDGNFIIGGAFTYIGNTPASGLAKLDKSGAVNSVFVKNNPLSRGDIVSEMQMSPDGKLFVGGYFRNMLGADINSLIRISTNGTLDTSFVTSLTPTANYGLLTDFIVMKDRIIACGNYSGYVSALDFNGNTVSSFNKNIFGSQYVGVESLCKIDEDNFAIGGEVLNGEGFLWVMDLDGFIDNAYVRQDHIPLSSEHMVKVGNELYRSGHIVGGQSSLDANFIYKYNLVTGTIEQSNFYTTTLSKNLHMLALNDTMAVISGSFDHFNKSVANNFAVADYDGTRYERLTFQVSPGIDSYYLEKSVRISGDQILLLGQFHKINNQPYYSVAMLNYTNFKTQVQVNETYTIPEDTTFHFSDLVKIIDLDDHYTLNVQPSDNLTVGQNEQVTLKENFNGSIHLQFSVADPFSAAGPFTTTFEVQPVNDAPKINNQLDVPNILPGDKYEIALAILDASDVEGDHLTLKVHAGEHYTLSGGSNIVSDQNFSGRLHVGVSVSDGSLASDVFMLSIESGVLTGVEKVSALAFYPNPFTDYIRINSSESIDHLSIHSITGEALVDYNHFDLQERANIIPTNTFPNGMYLVSVQLRTKEMRYLKLIKK
jgi:uncharacterized delta-60 repeat protein